jgi:replicative DNA helicase
MTELYHIESEQSILGGLLIDPNAFDRIDSLSESDFYREDHRLIYRHIAHLIADGKPVDVITVAESLMSAGVENESIGLAYLGGLASNTPSAANIRRYAEVVRDKRKLRDLLYISSQVADLAQSPARPAADLIDEAQALVFSLGDDTSGRSEPECVGALLDGVIGDIQARFENGGRIVGLPTGFADLDEKTCGLSGGDLVVIAGRPAMGKTAIALNIAEHVALSGKTALVFSMEMSKKQLVERLLSSIGRIPLNVIRSGNLNDDQFGQLSFSMGKLIDSKLIVDDKPALRISQMRSRARRVARKHGLALIVVDYIQLATGDGNNRSNREQEVSSVSRGLKAIAKEFNVPVIAISQLSRKVDERADNRPVLSDLRDSGAIEQDADIVLMMYRDEYYHKDSPDRGTAEAIIGKHRQGETGMVPLVFLGEFTRFEAMTYEARREMFARREAEKPVRRKKGFE